MSIGGRTAYFEADSVAAFDGGRIHVGEIKSFPKVDGRVDPDKLVRMAGLGGWRARWLHSHAQVIVSCRIVSPRTHALYRTTSGSSNLQL